MKQTIHFGQFLDGFRGNENFSYRGLRLLFDYLEELEEGTGEELEFDPVEIRCSYTEYANLAEFLEEHEAEPEFDDVESLEDLQEVLGVVLSEDFSPESIFIVENF